jgi:hypothetical protein
VERLREWALRLRREATVSVVDHQPRDCGELATLLEAVLASAVAQQPPPVPQPRGVSVFPVAVSATPSESLRKALTKREAIGVERYGQPLHTHNGRDALRDAREELADATAYLTQVWLETGSPQVVAARTLVCCAWDALEYERGES